MIGVLRWVTNRGKARNVVIIPAEKFAKAREQREKARLRLARHRYGKPNPNTNNPYKNKFIAWDGEGPQDAGYALFGNSEGDEICRPFLSTIDCLELVLEAARKYPGAIHIWFGANYDVSNILKDLPRRTLAVLHKSNACVWKDYEIKHISHKWLEVKHGNLRIILYDIHAYFGCSYVDALTEFGLDKSDDMGSIVAGKSSRKDFVWADIEYIRSYFRLELRQMLLLAEQLREAFSDAGYLPRAWYGPGAIARLALRRHKVARAITKCPPNVRLAALYAFAAGRFESILAGHANRECWIGDIHSAYPYYATKLPNLARGKWKHTRKYMGPDTFAVYNIRYETRATQKIQPLFRRMENSEIAWPYRVTGWYWTPEADLVKDNPDAKFLEGWYFDETDSSDRPLAWLADYYDHRLRLKRNGSFAQYTFKLIINSVYGQFAQRAGWNKKRGTPPAYHQIEWAGYITSSCRAAIYKVALSCGDDLVSIDTDSVTSLRPIEGIDIGDGLGQWEVTHYDDGIFWQSGIYCLKTNDCRCKGCPNRSGNSEICGHMWPANKTRGIPKDSYTYKRLLDCLASRAPLTVLQHVFVTYTQALNGDWNKLNTWEDRPHEYKMGGRGKRTHQENHCQKTCRRPDGLHVLTMNHMKYGPNGSAQSIMHYVPWMKHSKMMHQIKEMMDDNLIVHDEMEEWEWMNSISSLND
jgi:hypothetical protein